jgi:hypothetical protein
MRIALATRHADREFIPLALMYLKASVIGRGCCAPGDIAILEFDRDAAPEAGRRGLAEGTRSSGSNRPRRP